MHSDEKVEDWKAIEISVDAVLGAGSTCLHVFLSMPDL
jgi:hypothetical protein